MAAFLSPLNTSFSELQGYTAAFTCQSQDDEVPEGDVPQPEDDDEIIFTAGQNVEVFTNEVFTNEVATVNFE